MVTYNLVEELVKMGHDVTLLASGDSTTSAKLVSIFPENLRKFSSPILLDKYKYIGVAKALKFLKDNKFDVVHNHIGWRMVPFCDFVSDPVVTTLHGPMSSETSKLVFGANENLNYISISMSQRKPMPNLNYVGNVYNGIDETVFEYNETPSDYFAFLGRMSPEKGPVEAIKIAKMANVKLKMAAKVDASDQDYFNREVKPLIDGNQIEFIGEINHKNKVDFLKNAQGLISPIQWDEPFGLVFIEAMICGTPVFTFGRGSVSEIIIHNKNGFIGRDNEDIAERIKSGFSYDRRFCHDFVVEHFSAKKMAQNYIEIYKRLSNGTKVKDDRTEEFVG